MIQRVVAKGRKIASFFRDSRTPMALTLDSLRLRRSPFVAVSRDGIRLKIRPSRGESFTFYENVLRRDYLNHGIGLGPGDTVVDIGANIGAFAVLAASIVGPRGRVIAFEPVADSFERLGENVALNGLGNVECRRAAIDGEEGEVTIRIASKSSLATAHRVNGIGDDRPGETVPCLTLERVFEEFGIDRIRLLKVNCEGSEYGIFESLSPGLAARIDQIAMEVHPVEGRSLAQLEKGLGDLGFEVHPSTYPWVAFRPAHAPVGRA